MASALSLRIVPPAADIAHEPVSVLVCRSLTAGNRLILLCSCSASDSRLGHGERSHIDMLGTRMSRLEDAITRNPPSRELTTAILPPSRQPSLLRQPLRLLG